MQEYTSIAERNREILRMHRERMSYKDIAKRFEISPARVGQIVAKGAEDIEIVSRVYLRSDKVFRWIVSYKIQHDGVSPTVHEIRAGTGAKSTSTVWRYLAALAERGLIRGGERPRGIEIVEGYREAAKRLGLAGGEDGEEE